MPEREKQTIREEDVHTVNAGELVDDDREGVDDETDEEILPPDGRAEDPDTGERVSSQESRERQAAVRAEQGAAAKSKSAKRKR
jgi:hypothetical protein